MSEGRVRDVAGIGSMVVDRLHRIPRVLGAEEKGILRPMPDGKPEQTFVGGVVLNHLGWAAALGLRTGVFGKQAEDENGRFLRAAMDRLGIERDLVLDGSASSFAHIFVDDEGGRAIYMAPGATSETTSEQIRTCHAEFISGSHRVSTEVSQLPLAAALEVLRIAEEAGVPSVVDLDVPPSDAVPGLGDQATLEAVLRRATLLKPAKAAARELLPDAGGDALAIAEGMRARYGNQAVVVTDGEAGCAIAAAGVALRVPAFPGQGGDRHHRRRRRLPRGPPGRSRAGPRLGGRRKAGQRLRDSLRREARGLSRGARGGSGTGPRALRRRAPLPRSAPRGAGGPRQERGHRRLRRGPRGALGASRAASIRPPSTRRSR